MPVGPSPFQQDFSDWYKKERHTANKKEMKGLQAGYPTRSLRSNLTGDVYLLPRQDYEELVKHFGEHQSELSEGYKDGKKLYKNIHTPADYIDYAFDTKLQKANIYTQECQGGHIKALTYNSLYMLLMVEFTNRGDVVVFFNLPANVANELMYLAKSNTMAPSPVDGTTRHAVGVQFWNLVRVRGTVHDTRFPFQYTKDFRTGNAFGRQEGVGPDGGPSKWIYNREPTPDKRYKDIGNEYTDTDEKGDKKGGIKKEGRQDIVYRTTPLRVSRESYEHQKKMLEGNNNYDDGYEPVDDMDLDDYFDDTSIHSGFEGDLRRLGNNSYSRKLLLEAKEKYDTLNYADPNEIANLLRKAGGII